MAAPELTITHVLLVGAGGALGSVLRFGMSGVVHKVMPATFPLGTMIVNVVGCLAIGAIAGIADSRDVMTPATRAFLMLGLLGGFTTFSAFGDETHSLFRDGQHVHAGANALLSVVLCLVAVWVGYQLAHSKG